jgi:hypothetical protein
MKSICLSSRKKAIAAALSVRHRPIGIKLQVGSTVVKPLTTAPPTIETASGTLAYIDTLEDKLVVAEACRSRWPAKVLAFMGRDIEAGFWGGNRFVSSRESEPASMHVPQYD